MNADNKNPLTPALCKLLEACLILKTTDAKTLAIYLNRSPATIRTEFQRILELIGVHSRYAALKTAEEQGWLNTQKTSEKNYKMNASALLVTENL
jgi:DNA-binding NarL/FixJ family response regulator